MQKFIMLGAKIAVSSQVLKVPNISVMNYYPEITRIFNLLILNH